MLDSNLTHALLIFLSTFVLEDIAVLGAALLVVNSMMALPWAAASSLAGIWIGDFGLYMIARHFGRPVFERSWFKRLIGKKIDLTRSEGWFRDHGTAAIAISRRPESQKPIDTPHLQSRIGRHREVAGRINGKPGGQYIARPEVQKDWD